MRHSVIVRSLAQLYRMSSKSMFGPCCFVWFVSVKNQKHNLKNANVAGMMLLRSSSFTGKSLIYALYILYTLIWSIDIGDLDGRL